MSPAICRRTLLAALVLVLTSPLNAQVVATYDFETGTAQGWSSFNYASTPIATKAAAYSGQWSLLTTTNSSGAGGPSIALNNILQPGAKYTITGWVRLAAGTAATNADFTIKRTDSSCSGGCYDTVGSYQVPVTSSGWAQIGGSYTATTTETGLLLYAQLVGATTATSFYLDDVVITQTAPPPGGTLIATYTFADGGLDGWAPFGSPKLTNVAAPVAGPSGDTRVLSVTNRTAAYMGPGLNLLHVNKIVAGATYQVTAYVLLAKADATNPTATLSIKTTDCADTSGAYSNIATSGALSTTAWTKLQGVFSYSDQPGPPTSLTLYMQSSSATDSFYLAHVVISELSPPPLPPSQQDNSGISTTFEDGGLDGWGSRSGSSTLANSTAAAHTGTHSLLVSGRVANWDGAQISVSDKMYVGSLYNVSVWVRMLPTGGSSHTVNLSLQTTLDGNVSYNSVSPYPGISVPADGAWHQISATGYTMSNAYDTGQAYLYLQTVPSSGNDLASFYVDDFKLTYVKPPVIQTDIPSIYKTWASDFRVGAAIDPADLSGPHAQLLARHFDSITSGNEMKWSFIEPSYGSFTFAGADSEVGLAVCNNMHIRGHNLVWAGGAETPSYATGDGTNSAANQATVTKNIQEHIQNEVQHFGSAVYAWDVVNEPLDPSQSDCLLHGPFYKVLGKSYLDIAIKAARQYAPAGTKLFLNEWGTDEPARLACLVTVVKDLQTRGIPIDGVGHEMHNAINYPSTAAIANAINTVASNFPTLLQQVTELDMSVYNGGDTTTNYGSNIPAHVLAEQGWLYKSYFDTFQQLKGKLSAVTFWGFADDDTWLDGFPVTRTDYPLPFDHNLQSKPAFWGIVDPTKLPGYGLTWSIVSKTGATGARVWTLTAKNGPVGTAYAVQITGFKLTQTAGKACTPVVHAPSTYPVLLGDIPLGKSSNAVYKINFTGCPANAAFTLSVPWNSAVYDTGTFTATSQQQ
ncbi:MAG: endo-1,4-beta-xylanase [Terracidiphilus sp.]